MLAADEFIIYRPLRLLRLGLGKASRIQNLVLEKCVVDIVDGNHDITRAAVGRRVILFDIPDLGHQNSSQLLLDYIVDSYLQIPVDGQVQVVARLGLSPLGYLENLSQVVHIELFHSLFPLQIGLHILFNPGFSDDIVQGIAVILFLQLIQLLLGGFSGIADNMGKIQAVVISAEESFLNLYPLKLIAVCHDNRHRFVADIRGDGGGHILLIVVSGHGKPHAGYFQYFFF